MVESYKATCRNMKGKHPLSQYPFYFLSPVESRGRTEGSTPYITIYPSMSISQAMTPVPPRSALGLLREKLSKASRGKDILHIIL
jgi:hypothetical protein